MPQFYTAGQLFTIVKDLCQNEMDDLSTDSNGQQDAVFRLINLCSWRLPRIHYLSVYSDAKTISADGFVTFQLSSTDIADLFEPLMILDANDKRMQQRTSDDAPIGWWRESHNLEIHIRGFNYTRPLIAGPYTLKYLKYPKQITLEGDKLEIAPSGYYQLVHDVARLIKLTRNSYQGSEFMGTQAEQSLTQTVQGAISGRGIGSGTTPPGLNDVKNARGAI